MSQTLYDFPAKRTNLFVTYLLLYEVCTYISNDMIMPGMLNVIQTFNAPESKISMSLTAFILGGSSLQIFIGPLSDRFGRRPVMLFGAAFFLICTLLIGLSGTMNQFILARFFQGMGLCFISVVGYSTLQEIFSEMHAVRLVSLMSNITILAPLAGPLLGAVVLLFFAWRSIFYSISFFTAISVIGLWIYMPETVNKYRLDGSYNERTSLQLSVIKKNYATLIKNLRFMLGSLNLGLANAPLIAWIGTSPIILVGDAKLSLISYGLLQIPIFISLAIGTFVMRKLSYKKSLPQLINLGTKIIMLGLLTVVALLFILSSHYIAFIVGLSIYAFGLGFSMAPLNRLTLFATLIPKGTASALISIISMLCIAAGNEIGSYMYVNYGAIHFALFCLACSITCYTCFHIMNRSK